MHNMVLGKSDGFHFAYISSLHKVKIIQSKICLDGSGSGNDNEASLIFDASQLSSPSCFFSSHFFFFFFLAMLTLVVARRPFMSPSS